MTPESGEGFERVPLPDGAILRRRVGEGSPGRILPEHFDPAWWEEQGRVVGSATGRGRVWFVSPGGSSGQWALRHCERGGAVRRLLGDRYLWLGEARVRAFQELLLLERLSADGLPVPVPVGARYHRTGPWYRADIITDRLPRTEPLSMRLAGGDVPAATWIAIGRTIRRFHDAGVDHADLNAHNILLSEDRTRAEAGDAVWLLDFDRGRIRAQGRWAARSLRRLHRSLRKLTGLTPPGWSALMDAYGESGAE